MKRGMVVVSVVLGTWMIAGAAIAQDITNPPTAPALPEAAVSVPAVKQPETPAPAPAAITPPEAPAMPEAAAVPAVEAQPADAAAALKEAAKPAEAPAMPEAAAVPAVEAQPADAAAALKEAAKPAEAPAAVVAKPVESNAVVSAAPPFVPAAPKAPALEELKAAEEALGNPGQIKAGEAVAQQEKVRREADTIEGKKLLAEADKAYQAESYAHASQLYRDALGKLPVGKENRALRTHASERATEAVYEQARLLYKQGKLDEAMELIQQALAVTPDNKPLRRLMSRIQDDQAHAVSAGPGPAHATDKVVLPQGRVNELLQSAANYLAVRDYARAKTALESVLALEPGNREALRILKEVNTRRYVKNSVERDATVAGMSADVRAKWNPPAYKIVEPPKQVERARVLNSQPIVEKMRRIIIPEIEFRQANVHDVVDFLNKASREGDKETTDPTQKGVNIILNLNPGQAGASAAPAAAAADPFAAAAPGGATGAGGGRGSYEITFQARYINLEAALKIITSVSGLKYLVDGSVVMIVPADYDPAEIVTRMYPVEPDFVGRVKDTAAAMAPARAGTGGREVVELGNADTKTAIPDLKEYFEKMGVIFPKTASITYNAAIGKLIVANTTQNLVKFEEILDGLNKALKKIQQVEIEARFVEVNETDLRELGLEWLLNSSWQILQNKTAGTLPGGRQRIQVNANNSSGGFTKGLNFFGTDPQNGTVAPLAGGKGLLGGLLSVSSILTNPELGVIVHALEQNGNADLLSAPKVTTQVGTEASIRVVTEFIYPTEFTMTTPPKQGAVFGGAAALPQPLVAIPANFVTREVGVILQVMPELSADGNVINLTMTPQVVREPTWFQYGATIPDGVGGTYQVNMPQPFFHTRSITTKIAIYDGATVVMGGLIVESVEKFNDKIPVLGDIPLLGAFFRSKGEHSVKQNLLIFVTANVVDPAGRAARDLAVQGETVTPVSAADTALPTPAAPAAATP